MLKLKMHSYCYEITYLLLHGQMVGWQKTDFSIDFFFCALPLETMFLKKQFWLWQTDSVSSVQVSIVSDIMTNLPPIILSNPIITLSKTSAKASALLVVSNFEMGGTGVGPEQKARLKPFSI